MQRLGAGLVGPRDGDDEIVGTDLENRHESGTACFMFSTLVAEASIDASMPATAGL